VGLYGHPLSPYRMENPVSQAGWRHSDDLSFTIAWEADKSNAETLSSFWLPPEQIVMRVRNQS
jgi:hypothetical protein